MTIRAGDIRPLHTHLTPTVVYVISGSHSIRRDEHGTTVFDTRADPGFVLPRVLFQTPTPRHPLENTGSDDLVVIGVELAQIDQSAEEVEPRPRRTPWVDREEPVVT